VFFIYSGKYAIVLYCIEMGIATTTMKRCTPSPLKYFMFVIV
jgi:hypothetical protein